jgi:hypothetical protein
MVDKVALDQISSKYFGLPCQFRYHVLLSCFYVCLIWMKYWLEFRWCFYYTIWCSLCWRYVGGHTSGLYTGNYVRRLVHEVITLAARSEALTFFARSNAGIVGSNPTQGMDACVRLFCVCVVLCVDSGLATGWTPVQGVLSTLYKIKNLKKRPRSKKGL